MRTRALARARRSSLAARSATSGRLRRAVAGPRHRAQELDLAPQPAGFHLRACLLQAQHDLASQDFHRGDVPLVEGPRCGPLELHGASSPTGTAAPEAEARSVVGSSR